jgi:hypothetical protein
MITTTTTTTTTNDSRGARTPCGTVHRGGSGATCLRARQGCSGRGITVYDDRMSSDDGMRVVGTIRSIELHTLSPKFQNVAARQVAKIQLDIERAIDENGAELDIGNLVDLQFQGPPELVPRFSAGDRVQIVTSVESSLHITSIRPAPLS